MRLKRKIKMLINENSIFFRVLRYIYCLFKNPKRVMYKKSFGNINSDKTIYIIRPTTEDCIQGLLSLFIQVVRQIDYAKKSNYTAYVDFKKISKRNLLTGIHTAIVLIWWLAAMQKIRTLIYTIN